MIVIPAILTNSPQEFKKLIDQVERVYLDKGDTGRVQIDIIDGKFAQNKTVDPYALSYIETNLKIDFHLMVREPANWIEKCLRVGGDRIIGQIELMEDQLYFVQKAQELGLKVGLAIDLDTPVSRLYQKALKDVDVVLTMSVKAGLGGQKFNPLVLDKLKQLGEIRKQDLTPFSICTDGGITLQLVETLSELGVDEVAVGRRIFEGNLSDNIKKFSEA